MLILHIALPAKEGNEQALEQMFLQEFRPALSAQEGFHDVQLLRSLDDKASYCLVIAFEKPEDQQKWVASDLHQQVWPALADNCTDFSLQKYDSVS
jgi:heme-degrading monooxygenase HmoA